MTETFQNGLSAIIRDALIPLIGNDTQQICLIDPPNHSNVGDSAILLGELDFIERHFPQSRTIFYDSATYSAAAHRHIEKSSVILLHGGGNFGDIWPAHHNLRLNVLNRFPHIKTIQFPQSIHFGSDAEIERTKRSIGQHNNFTLLVRDEKSLTFANMHFDCVTKLVPDMAFAMKPIYRDKPSLDFYCLLRTDKERAANHPEIQQILEGSHKGFEIGDWIRSTQTPAKLADRIISKLIRNAPTLASSSMSFALSVRRQFAFERLKDGQAKLSRGENVVTDRLHGHIISTLLDIPHFVFDSYDGKVSAFYEAWTNKSPLSKFVQNADEFRAALI